ncbi:MAG: UDP-N-acetylglucosamine 2-epimerase (non-hydrolyzing) [Gammaproteobacteria bacterium]|nr:UDP-N-acetylglucosamine 2-epimerase (non-hydrolyzing) [Gammaproteobacteria bacterium]
MNNCRIHLIAAARPNFMKVAPLYHALAATDWATPVLVHTGQHYDRNMSDAILEDLGIPEPDHHLGVGSGTHAEQTGNVMIAYEKLCMAERPDWIIVVGDVNSTAACAQVGAKLWIPVVHLEAGLRSGDRTMPEEINRLITDAIVDVLWTPSADADENLLAEGVSKDKIELIGNIMIDSFEMLREKIEASNAQAELGLESGNYALVTLHRPSNVDTRENLAPIVDALVDVSKHLQVVFVAHPRTIAGLGKFGLDEKLAAAANVKLLEPLPYIRFMNIVTGSRLVITDSGGLQEETTYLNIPCLTMRENTERPITVTQGSNKLVRAENLAENLAKVLAGNWPSGSCPPLWDGKTAQRAVEKLRQRQN